MNANHGTSFAEYIAVAIVILLTTLFLFSEATKPFRERFKNVVVASPAGGGGAQRRLSPPGAAHRQMNNPKSTVLVVDDDPVTRLQLGSRLKRRGFAVMEVCDGTEAIKLYDEGHRFCLVVMDYEMPELNGVETITQIRRRDHNAIVIGSTIHDAAQKQQRFLSAGANKVARTKPIMDDEIDELVTEYELL